MHTTTHICTLATCFSMLLYSLNNMIAAKPTFGHMCERDAWYGLKLCTPYYICIFCSCQSDCYILIGTVVVLSHPCTYIYQPAAQASCK